MNSYANILINVVFKLKDVPITWKVTEVISYQSLENGLMTNDTYIIAAYDI